jgi:chromosome segregation ATPase
MTCTQESEIVKARLKLEATEQQAADAKKRFGDLVDKYSEAQRAIADLKQSCATLSAELAGNDEAEQRCAALGAEHERMVAAHEAELRLLREQHQGQLQRLESACAELQAQLHSLQHQSKVDTESAAVFESYKKRAQVSMKKVRGIPRMAVLGK